MTTTTTISLNIFGAHPSIDTTDLSLIDRTLISRTTEDVLLRFDTDYAVSFELTRGSIAFNDDSVITYDTDTRRVVRDGESYGRRVEVYADGRVVLRQGARGVVFETGSDNFRLTTLDTTLTTIERLIDHEKTTRYFYPKRTDDIRGGRIQAGSTFSDERFEEFTFTIDAGTARLSLTEIVRSNLNIIELTFDDDGMLTVTYDDYGNDDNVTLTLLEMPYESNDVFTLRLDENGALYLNENRLMETYFSNSLDIGLSSGRFCVLNVRTTGSIRRRIVKYLPLFAGLSLTSALLLYRSNLWTSEASSAGIALHQYLLRFPANALQSRRSKKLFTGANTYDAFEEADLNYVFAYTAAAIFIDQKEWKRFLASTLLPLIAINLFLENNVLKPKTVSGIALSLQFTATLRLLIGGVRNTSTVSRTRSILALVGMLGVTSVLRLLDIFGGNSLLKAYDVYRLTNIDAAADIDMATARIEWFSDGGDVATIVSSEGYDGKKVYVDDVPDDAEIRTLERANLYVDKVWGYLYKDKRF